ncbi:MAG TPA: FecR family protein [Candidatus Xenobia bacterium]|nr:FecR family protein [Candidatus Xenobia bacterium]
MKPAASFALLIVLLPVAARAQTTPARAGEVSALLPVGRIQRGANAAAEAKLHDELLWRDWFETAAKGRARLALVDGSQVNVGSEARLQVLRATSATQQTELELQFGKIRSQVTQRPAGEKFEVRTNSAVIGVIGTHFYVSYAGVLSTVINFGGQVGVRNADPAVAGEETLQPFELAEIEPGRPPRKRWATPEELRQALEDTLPGPVTGFDPWTATPGACVNAIARDPLRAATGAAAFASTPFFEVKPQACSAHDIQPVRICVPPGTEPGVYDYALNAADGTQRWGGFLVRPPAPLDGARLVYSPEMPPGATQIARVVDREGQPLPGIPVRIRRGSDEITTKTDDKGEISITTFKYDMKGQVVTLEVIGQPAAAPPAELPQGRIRIVDNFEPATSVPDFSERGGVLNLPGEVRGVKLGSLDLPVARTTTRDGRTVSTVAIPPDAPGGNQPLEIEDAAGERQRRSTLVYEVLAARLDQAQLRSFNETAGEFLVCVGPGERKGKVRARITATGPVHFRGQGGKGKRYERAFAVTPTGLLRIPFQIQAEKGGPGVGIPFTLTLQLTED